MTDRAALEARRKLAHSKVSRDAWVEALTALGLRLRGMDFEETANKLIGELPVHQDCIYTSVDGRLLPMTEPTS